MKKMLIYLFSVVFVLSMTFMGVGCKEAAEPEVIIETVTETVTKTVTVEVEKDEPVELLFWHEPFAELDWDLLVSEYKADTGSTTEIRQVEYPFTGLEAAVLIALQSDTFPDIYYGASSRLLPLINLGVFDEIPEGLISRETWSENAFDSGNILGKQIFVGTHLGYWPLVINKALFKKAGVENLIPDEETRTWTRDEYVEAAEAIGKLGNDIYGISFDLVWNDTDKSNDAYVWADGDGWSDETLVNATFNTPKNIENFEWLINVMQSDYVYPNPMSLDVFPHVEDFIAGKVGIMSEMLGTMEQLGPMYESGEASRDVVDPMYVFFPTDDGSPSKTFILSNGFAIKKQDDEAKIAAAQDFLKWIYDADSVWMQYFANTPHAGSLANDIYSEDAIVGMEEVFFKLGMPTMEGVELLPHHTAIPGFRQLRTMWLDNVHLAYLNELTPEEARNKMQEEAQQIIDDTIAEQEELTSGI